MALPPRTERPPTTTSRPWSPCDPSGGGAHPPVPSPEPTLAHRKRQDYWRSTAKLRELKRRSRALHCPRSHNANEADVLVGPSHGFRWAEDGGYTLQAVRPAVAGQDIGLAGIVWLAPMYAAAFTRYALESS